MEYSQMIDLKGFQDLLNMESMQIKQKIVILNQTGAKNTPAHPIGNIQQIQAHNKFNKKIQRNLKSCHTQNEFLPLFLLIVV